MGIIADQFKAEIEALRVKWEEQDRKQAEALAGMQRTLSELKAANDALLRDF